MIKITNFESETIYRGRLKQMTERISRIQPKTYYDIFEYIKDLEEATKDLNALITSVKKDIKKVERRGK